MISLDSALVRPVGEGEGRVRVTSWNAAAQVFDLHDFFKGYFKKDDKLSHQGCGGVIHG